MERILEFEKYRNIGLNSKERIVLNNSLEKGKMGNLVIVIGANNSGKSNVLEALISYGNKSIKDRDITTLSYEDKDRIPSLTFATKDGDDIYSHTVSLNQKNDNIEYPGRVKTSILDSKYKKKIEEGLEILNELNKLNPNDKEIKDTINLLKSPEISFQKLAFSEEIIKNKIEEFYSNSNNQYNIYNYHNHKINFDNKFAEYELLLDVKYGIDSKISIPEEGLKEVFEKKYKINFFSKIYLYTENKIAQENLQINPQAVSQNDLFKKIFKSIGLDIKNLQNAYERFQKLNDKGVLSNCEAEINKKLKIISKKFNKLYYLSDESYNFEIDLETNSIYFKLKRDNRNITFDHQSTGFKWFFNLYFNLLCSNDLNPGDIIIMDEPATNLHVSGQKELRDFLKEFAIANDVTVLIATHSPFLIDVDYLDEVRVVKMDDNVAKIINDFTQIDLEDPDSLSQIKKSLTISNHILYNPDNKVVFVEGITDYNYMVAFKKIFKIEDVIFIPIKGVGKDKEMQKEISKRLIQLRKSNPILMVDSDKAGKAMKESNNYDSALEVFTLADIDPQFKEIEYLFSEEDIKKFNLKVQNGFNKSSSHSAFLKTHMLNEKNVSQQTKENFKKIFDYIEKL